MKTITPVLCLFVILFSLTRETNAIYVAPKPSFLTPDYKISDFSTDGCSAYPDGNPLTKANEWIHCCIAHDMYYWIGGTQEEKEFADDQLRQCVASETTEDHASFMELGVIIGGTPYALTSWRWGYGWNKIFPYRRLKEEEKAQVYEKFDSILYAIKEQKDTGSISSHQAHYLIVKFEELREDIIPDNPIKENQCYL